MLYWLEFVLKSSMSTFESVYGSIRGLCRVSRKNWLIYPVQIMVFVVIPSDADFMPPFMFCGGSAAMRQVVDAGTGFCTITHKQRN